MSWLGATSRHTPLGLPGVERLAVCSDNGIGATDLADGADEAEQLPPTMAARVAGLTDTTDPGDAGAKQHDEEIAVLKRWLRLCPPSQRAASTVARRLAKLASVGTEPFSATLSIRPHPGGSWLGQAEVGHEAASCLLQGRSSERSGRRRIPA